MSGFATVLREVGLRKRPLKKSCRHRKLTEEMLALFQVEAQKHADLMAYDELARRSGMTLGTVRSLMAQLIREKREKTDSVHRGTKMSELEIGVSP